MDVTSTYDDCVCADGGVYAASTFPKVADRGACPEDSYAGEPSVCCPLYLSIAIVACWGVAEFGYTLVAIDTPCDYAGAFSEFVRCEDYCPCGAVCDVLRCSVDDVGDMVVGGD